MDALLLGAVAPWPIAFACTVGEKGSLNLSLFSFLNAFSVKLPLMLIEV